MHFLSDKEKPEFLNCPTEIVINHLGNLYFDEPEVTDNTAIKSLDRYPQNIRSGMSSEAGSITFIATDYNNNTQWCQFRVVIKGNIYSIPQSP